jgi:hypothetical protein
VAPSALRWRDAGLVGHAQTPKGVALIGNGCGGYAWNYAPREELVVCFVVAGDLLSVLIIRKAHYLPCQ